MELAAAIFAKIVPRAPVLLVVLVRDQRVEHLEHLAAHVGDRVERDDEDEVVPADVPDEPAVAEQSFHDVVEDARQDVDDPIAVVVAVAIVVLLEMIQVGVTYGEQLAVFHAPPDLARDVAVNPSTRLPGTTEIEREIRRCPAGGWTGGRRR